MKSIAFTHIGKRKENQDVVLVHEINQDTMLYLVVDGMGGYTDGKKAAEITSESISTFLSNSTSINKDSIQMSVNKANLAIRQFQESNNSNLGATVGGIVITKNKAQCFCVGDVGVFHYSKGKLTFESKAHNLVNDLKHTGSLKTSSLEKLSHIVTRSIQGNVKKSVISYHVLILEEHDSLIICSDGVHNITDSHTILYHLNKEQHISESIETISQRIEKEADDNASLIAIYGFNEPVL